ncbi:paeninodin family lasso peptide [Paenibacillus tarimensis]
MVEQSKKAWSQPTLECLNVDKTMGGPNGVVPDQNGKGANNRNQPMES